MTPCPNGYHDYVLVTKNKYYEVYKCTRCGDVWVIDLKEINKRD